MGEKRRSGAGNRSGNPARSARSSVWVVSDEAVECDHPGGALRLVGDDGRNAYYRCERCDAVIVTQDELVRAATGETGNGADARAVATDRSHVADPEAPG